MNSPFGISEKEIADLFKEAFADVVNRLIGAESSRIGLLPSNVQTSLLIDDPDGGVDARIIDAPDGSRWIPQGLSVWQFKSGQDHEPAKLKGEFNKPRVQEALQQGGYYVIVISERLSDQKFRSRRNTLDNCCLSVGIEIERCRIYSASQLAQWASEHPSIWFLPYFPRPMAGDWMRWDRWANNDRFQQEFKPDQARKDVITAAYPSLKGQNDLLHIRIEGLAGIGKTRLALEIFRPRKVGLIDTDGLSDRIMYAGRPQDIPEGLFYWLEVHSNASLTLVVDECDQVEADRLALQLQRCDGRVRLLTIGLSQEAYAVTSRPRGLYLLDKLDDETMQQLLRDSFPSLLQTAIDFITRLSSGFVKLATAIARAVEQQPELVAAHSVARDYEVRNVLHRFLLPNAQDFRAMQVAALLTRIGWEDELALEGQAVAQFMRITWEDAQDSIQRQVNEGLVSKQGRYRYVTPHLLAVWLSAEAWEARGHGLLELMGTLPTWNSRHAMLERLRDLGDHPRAQQVVETLLSPNGLFRDLESINDERRAQIFEILAEAHPRAGLRALQRLWENLPRDELVRLDVGRPRIVRTLEKLAWLPETFFGAARLLLALADAENQSWANNASGTWVGLFSTYLGGTAIPAIERHSLITEALNSNSTERQLLAVHALSAALSSHEIRMAGAELQGGRRVPQEWHPSTRQEDQQVRLSALTLLDRALACSTPVVREAAESVLLDDARQLVEFGMVDALLERLERLPLRDDTVRHTLRDTLESILEWEGGYLTSEQRKRTEALRGSLVGESYHDRLRRWVGRWTVGDLQAERIDSSRYAEHNAMALADEAMQMPDLLLPELDWLFSEEAVNAHLFARRLGMMDMNYFWWSELDRHIHPGNGEPVVSNYLQGHVDAGRQKWRDQVLDAWLHIGAEKAYAVLDAIWRGPTDDQDALRLVKLIGQGDLKPESTRVLVWGGQTKHFSTAAFRTLIEAILQSSSPLAADGAVDLLEQRLDFHPEDIRVMEPLAWRAMENCSFPFSETMLEHDWNGLARHYLDSDPVRIAHILLSLFEKQAEAHNYIRNGPSLQTFSEATRLSPANVWSAVSEILMRRGRFGILLRLTLRGWYAEAVGTAILLAWAERNLPQGPRIVAEIATVGKVPLDELARELLVRFDDRQEVATALYANFGTGSWIGPASSWFQSRLEVAREWLKDPELAVRKWAQVEVDAIEQQLAHVTLEEVEAVH